MKKAFIYIFVTTCIIGIVVFMVFMLNMSNRGRKEFINNSYRGKISKIEYLEGRRGLPDVTIDSKVYYFGWEEKVKHYIQLGDSIVKNKGSETIIVYRRSGKGEWNAKVFK